MITLGEMLYGLFVCSFNEYVEWSFLSEEKRMQWEIIAKKFLEEANSNPSYLIKK